MQRKREGANVGKSLYCGFCRKELVRQSKWLELASLNNVSGLGDAGAVLSCWVPGSGVTRAEEE